MTNRIDSIASMHTKLDEYLNVINRICLDNLMIHMC